MSEHDGVVFTNDYYFPDNNFICGETRIFLDLDKLTKLSCLRQRWCCYGKLMISYAHSAHHGIVL